MSRLWRGSKLTSQVRAPKHLAAAAVNGPSGARQNMSPTRVDDNKQIRTTARKVCACRASADMKNRNCASATIVVFDVARRRPFFCLFVVLFCIRPCRMWPPCMRPLGVCGRVLQPPSVKATDCCQFCELAVGRSARYGENVGRWRPPRFACIRKSGKSALRVTRSSSQGAQSDCTRLPTVRHETCERRSLIRRAFRCSRRRRLFARARSFKSRRHRVFVLPPIFACTPARARRRQLARDDFSADARLFKRARWRHFVEPAAARSHRRSSPPTAHMPNLYFRLETASKKPTFCRVHNYESVDAAAFVFCLHFAARTCVTSRRLADAHHRIGLRRVAAARASPTSSRLAAGRR